MYRKPTDIGHNRATISALHEHRNKLLMVHMQMSMYWLHEQWMCLKMQTSLYHECIPTLCMHILHKAFCYSLKPIDNHVIKYTLSHVCYLKRHI